MHDYRTCEECAALTEHKKANLPDGPWQKEPDREEFKAHGLTVLLKRVESGHWCGYVGVPPGHPAHSKDYNDVNVIVHGGLTYAGSCNGCICHLPDPGEPEELWWLGFDCTHSGDYSPEYASLKSRYGINLMSNDVYRDINYVREEAISLAKQLAKL